jgi:hypothetical protein
VRLQTYLAAGTAALAAIVVPLAAGQAHRTGAVRPDAQRMVLQLRDLPSGFGLDAGAYVSNAELTRQNTRHKDYRRLGRLTGYNVTYKRTGLAGVLGVNAFASIYRSTAGAHDSFKQSLTGAAEAGGPAFKWLAVGASLGSESRLYLVTTRQSATKIDFYTVAWRHGPVFAEVMGGGVSGRVDADQVIALAEKQDARIAKALRS